MSSSSSSSRPHGQKRGLKKGGKWTGKLYFDPEAETPHRQTDLIADEELLSIGKVINLNLQEQKIHDIKVLGKSHDTSLRERLRLRQNYDHFSLRIHSVSSVDPKNENWWLFELNDKGILIHRDTDVTGKVVEIQDCERTDRTTTIYALLDWLRLKRSWWWPGGHRASCYDFVAEMYYFMRKEWHAIPKPYTTCGEKWAPIDGIYQVNFESVSCKLWLTAEELKTKLANLDGMKEVIKQVRAYKTPLSEFQLTFRIFYHLFIVLKTDSYWWSVEKDGECIILQRSKVEAAVKERCYQQPRVTGKYWKVTEMQSDTSDTTIESLLQWVVDKKMLTRRYHLLFQNCKVFARNVYDYVSKSDFLV